MEIFWFIAIGFMLTMYVILDGFDLGAGVIHLLVAKTEDERRTVLNSIGPVWDGNEVWLLAAGGTLYFAFPRVYASSFSGFYLPLMMVLWLLMLRAIGIEFRHHLRHPMWKAFWDVTFSLASTLLAIFFGAALGNVVRGVPLNPEGYFFAPLWTTFTVVPEAGILDWFTVIMGVVALATVTAHGAHFIAMKTTNALQTRARLWAKRAWYLTLAASLLAFLSTWYIHPEIWDNYRHAPWGFIFPVLGLLGWLGGAYAQARQRDSHAFFASSLFIAGMAASTAFGLFPTMLPASTDKQLALTIYNSAAQEYSLSVGMVWWIIGMVLAAGYFGYVFYSFRGKTKLPAEGEGY